MTTKYIKAIEQFLQTKYPQKQDQRAITIDNLKFKVFLPKTIQLLSLYSNILSLTLTHCDLRNLENFPRFLLLQQLDLGYNQIQGTLNYLMPLKRLNYLNVQKNIIFQSIKLAPLRKIVGGSLQKNLKIYICIKNNPFTTEESNFLSKIKAYGLKVVKEPSQYFEKKKSEQQKVLQKSKQLLQDKKKQIKKQRSNKTKARGSFDPLIDSSSSSSDFSSQGMQQPQFNSDFEQIIPVIRIPLNNPNPIPSTINQPTDINSTDRRRLTDHLNSRISAYTSNLSSQAHSGSRLLSLRTILGQNFNAQRVGGRIIVRMDSSGRNRERELFSREISHHDNNNFQMQLQRIENQDIQGLDQSQQDMQQLFGFSTNQNRRELLRNQSNQSVIRFGSISRNNSINSGHRLNPLIRNDSIQSRQSQQRSLRNSLSIRQNPMSIRQNQLSIRQRLERQLTHNQTELNRLRLQRQNRQRQRQVQRQRQSRRLQNLIAERQALLSRQQVRLADSINNSSIFGMSGQNINFDHEPMRQNICRIRPRNSAVLNRQLSRQSPNSNGSNIRNLMESLNRAERQATHNEQSVNHRGINPSRAISPNTVQVSINNRYSNTHNVNGIINSLNGSINNNQDNRINLSNSSSQLMFDNLQDEQNIGIERFNDLLNQDNLQQEELSQGDIEEDQNNQDQDDMLEDDEHECDSLCEEDHAEHMRCGIADEDEEDEDGQDDDQQEEDIVNPFQTRIEPLLFSARARTGEYSNGNQLNNNFIDILIEGSQSQAHQNVPHGEENQRSQVNQSQNDSSISSEQGLFQ